MSKTTAFLLLCLGAVFSTTAFSTESEATAEASRFKLGVGLLQINIQDAPKNAPNHRNFGGLVFAEYSESQHAASRFMVYSYDHKEAHLTGVETQLLLGRGLAQPGLRLYTGPTWFIEHLHLPNSKVSHTFKGLSWQLGMGWQYRALSVDYAVSMRQRRAYRSHFEKDGTVIGEVFNQSLLFSYQF